MSNEKIKAELEKYEAAVAKAIEKAPERKHLPEQRLFHHRSLHKLPCT